MPLSMHAASAPIFIRTLTSMLNWIDKAEAHATAKNFEPNNYVTLRLTPDIFAFARQIQITTDAAKNCVARLAGLEPPSWADNETTIEERGVDLPLGPDRSMTFTGQAFLTGFALPNFFFHASMTYALLRQGASSSKKWIF
jgi:uncharacterized protein